MPLFVRRNDRREIRRAHRFACQVVRERDFRLLGALALDLSPDGMLVLAEANVLTGERVLVSFRAPRSRWWIDAEASVARVVHGRRAGDQGRCFGLAFDGLDGREQRLLRSVLRGLPPPLPLRASRIDYAASAHLAALS